MTNIFDTPTADDPTDTGTDRLRINNDNATHTPTSPTDLTNTQSVDINHFECGWCGYSHETEQTVRAHITRNESGKHENKDAFLGDVFVQAYNSDGDLIGDMESPKATSLEEAISPEHLPGQVSADTTTAEILTLAIEHPSKDAEAIAKDVYKEAMSGNIAYVEDVIARHLSTDADIDADEVEPPQYTDTEPSADQERTRRALTATPSNEQIQKPSTEKSYDDLQPKQKAVINEYIRNPDQQITELEESVGVSTGYGNKVLDKYEHIVRSRRRQYENGDLELPSTEDVLGDESDTQTKAYEELSPLQQRVIDHWVRDPTQNKSEIEDKADASPGYSARLYRKYGDIRDRRRKAYTQGILTDEHLNTPDFDEFIEDTSLPRDEWERIEEAKQPRGTPLSDVPSADTTNPEHTGQSATEAESAEAPTAAPGLFQPTVDRLADISARLEQIESDLADNASSVTAEDLPVAEAESLATETAMLKSRLAILEENNPREHSTVETTETVEVEQQGGTAMLSRTMQDTTDIDGDTEGAEITLEDAEWATVVSALAHHTDTDEKDVLKDIVLQVQ